MEYGKRFIGRGFIYKIEDGNYYRVLMEDGTDASNICKMLTSWNIKGSAEEGTCGNVYYESTPGSGLSIFEPDDALTLDTSDIIDRYNRIFNVVSAQRCDRKGCYNCDKNDRMCYMSNPVQYRCTISGNYHLGGYYCTDWIQQKASLYQV